MAQSLISIITLAALVAASPLQQRQTSCSETWWSQAGDTCDSIGAMFGLTGDAIKQSNDYVDCNDIWVNTPICIPPHLYPSSVFLGTPEPSTTVALTCVQTYWSQAGDTCDSIGAMFGVYSSAILAANTYLNCSDIWVNTPVCIPNVPVITTSATSFAPPPPPTSSISCVETWWSQAGDTCDSIGAIFGLTGQTILDANTYLNCTDIWVNTPVCIPYLPAVTTIFPGGPTSSVPPPPPPTSTSISCVETWWSQAGDTCDSIGAIFGLTGDAIFNANTYLNCNDIWVNTPVCIPYLPSVTTIFPTYVSTSPIIDPPPVSTDTVPNTCYTTYTSVAGDTCDSIGAQYGLTGDQIWNANQFLTCDDIWAWTPICIPYNVDVFTTSAVLIAPVPSSTVVTSEA